MADDLNDDNCLVDESFTLKARKRPHEDEEDLEEDVEETVVGTDVEKKKKKKKLNLTQILELKKDELSKVDYSKNELKKILLDYVKKNLSVIDRQDLNLSDESILDKLILNCSKKMDLSLSEKIEKRFDEKFGELMQQKKSGKAKHKPFAIFLSSSAVRCIQVEKELRQLTKKHQMRWMFAFAKHKKLSEQVDFLKEKPVQIVFATPARLIQLIESDEKALQLSSLKYLIVDYSNRDCKLKRFVDQNEIRADFLQLFFKHVQPLNREKLKIKLFLV